MKPSKTSKTWMSEHVNDHYVQRAKAEGFRSRAAFKLMEIDDKDKLIKKGVFAVDLGAAPGGWSQVLALRGKENSKIIALDLLEMTGISGVDFICGDFREEAILAQLNAQLNGRKLDLVLSDMAPNMSGIAISDQARMIYLAELALDFCRDYLKPDGAFLIKIFQGAGFEEFVRAMRKVFVRVQTRKPDASRDRSAEVYLLGKELKK